MHGYDHPWAGGAGKNKFPMIVSSIKALNTSGTWNGNIYTLGDITIEILTDTDDNIIGFKINGTNSSTFTFVLTGTFDLAAGDYTLSSSNNFPGNLSCYLSLYTPEVGVNLNMSLSNQFSHAGGNAGGAYIYSAAGRTFNNFVITPMLCLSSASNPTTFEPYSNICPISGRTETNVASIGRNVWDEQWEIGMISSVDGQNEEGNSTIRSQNYIPVTPSTNYYIRCSQGAVILFYAGDKSYITYQNLNTGGAFTTPQNAKYIRFRTYIAYGTTYHNDICINISDASFNGQYVPYVHSSATIQLGQTVYGGQVDFNEGTVEVTDGYIASYDSETLPSTWISDRDVYAAGTTPTTGAEVCYALATPTTLTLTPDELTMLKGYNSVTGDGVITITAYTGSSYPVEITRKRKTKKKGGK